jgi:hypothetical protein
MRRSNARGMSVKKGRPIVGVVQLEHLGNSKGRKAPIQLWFIRILRAINPTFQPLFETIQILISRHVKTQNQLCKIAIGEVSSVKG